MKSQSQILEDFIDALTAVGVRYLIGGSVASSSIGIPRATLNTDFLVEMGGAQLALHFTELNWSEPRPATSKLMTALLGVWSPRPKT
jgi:hypothetical protein